MTTTSNRKRLTFTARERERILARASRSGMTLSGWLAARTKLIAEGKLQPRRPDDVVIVEMICDPETIDAATKIAQDRGMTLRDAIRSTL